MKWLLDKNIAQKWIIKKNVKKIKSNKIKRNNIILYFAAFVFEYWCLLNGWVNIVNVLFIKFKKWMYICTVQRCSLNMKWYSRCNINYVLFECNYLDKDVAMPLYDLWHVSHVLHNEKRRNGNRKSIKWRCEKYAVSQFRYSSPLSMFWNWLEH